MPDRESLAANCCCPNLLLLLTPTTTSLYTYPPYPVLLLEYHTKWDVSYSRSLFLYSAQCTQR